MTFGQFLRFAESRKRVANGVAQSNRLNLKERDEERKERQQNQQLQVD